MLVRHTLAIMDRADSRPGLRRLPPPVLVLCGPQDAITQLDGHEEIAALAPRRRLAVIEDCSHLLTWERPEAVTAELHRWLEQDAPSPSSARAEPDGDE